MRARVCCVRVRNAAKNTAPTGIDGFGEGCGREREVRKKTKTRTKLDTQARARVGAHQVRCFTALRAPGSLFHHARG